MIPLRPVVAMILPILTSPIYARYPVKTKTETWQNKLLIPPLTATFAIVLLKSRCVSPTLTDLSWIF